MKGSIGMPRLLPEITDQASFWKLFTTVPVLVTAYICHHNGKSWILLRVAFVYMSVSSVSFLEYNGIQNVTAVWSEVV